MGRQDDPPKVGFPIGLGRFLPLSLKSFFDHFGYRLIFVFEPKLTRKPWPSMPDSGRRPLKNNALRKKRSKGYMAKENRSKGALLRKIHLERSLSPKGCMDKATKTKRNTAKPV